MSRLICLLVHLRRVASKSEVKIICWNICFLPWLPTWGLLYQDLETPTVLHYNGGRLLFFWLVPSVLPPATMIEPRTKATWIREDFLYKDPASSCAILTFPLPIHHPSLPRGSAYLSEAGPFSCSPSLHFPGSPLSSLIVILIPRGRPSQHATWFYILFPTRNCFACSVT